MSRVERTGQPASTAHASPGPAGPAAPRETWGDVVKGVLIVLVVFWHVVMKSYLEVDWQLGVPIPGAWGLLADLIWPSLMPLFLLVSGYFAARAFTRPWAAVLRPRVVRFLYLYLLWSLIHAAALWAFPDFPTLVPRGVAEFVEAVTISPPNTWYLFALALYFLVAKGLARVSPWLVVGAAAVLSVVVAAGYLEIVSNRGSLLFNLTFFLLGLHLAPHVRRLAGRVRPVRLALLGAGYLAVFAAMRLTGSETVPGVWPLVSVVGVAFGLAAAPAFARIPMLGPGAAWLGRRSLAIYLLHMPLLAVADVVLAEWLSLASRPVQLAAAAALPPVLTAVLVAACVGLERVLVRGGARWLFDLPARRRAGSVPEPSAPGPARWPAWRAVAVVALVVASGVVAVRATAIPGCDANPPAQPAGEPGRVSIGAVGDVLMHDLGHGVPADGGAAHFDAVRPWFSQDLVTGNLEQVIADDPGYDKCDGDADCLAFRSAPDTARHLDGFDLMNLANNHTGDFGPVGYADTRANLAANSIRSVGDRNEIVCTRIGDTTVAVIGFAPYRDTNRVTDLRHARRLVAAAAASAEVVVVHAHMGAEGPTANVVAPGPEVAYGEQRGDVVAFSHAVVDAGADLVIGHGPHSLRGMEFYRGRLIAYSLGNFGGGGVFGAEQATRYGAYLDLTLDADGRFAGGRVRSIDFAYEGGAPRPDPEGAAARLMAEFGARDFPERAARIAADGTISPPSAPAPAD
ncbi:CapA family protein [Agromyces soli]|uniref:CapA family protein n=1 Tax=Agromyces soli TaxID=659012 RepID=A0ABY4AW05_9MICO|nr:CapA family protein [Agromyces soli]UOE27353.1 CapA family protein [Agromyces soli]